MIENNLFIVIAVHNRKTITLHCLNQLFQQSNTDFKIVVVDDGSSDGTYESILDSFPLVHLIKGNGNWWWTKSTNEGIKFARSKGASHILCLNDDTIFDVDYIKILHSYIDKYPNFVFGSVNLTDEVPSRVYFSGAYGLNKLLFRFKRYEPTLSSNLNFFKKKDKIKSIYLPGRGLLVPTSIYNNIGLFDEINFPQYGSDIDLTLRISKSNENVYIASKLILYTNLESTGSGDFYKNESFAQFISSFTNKYSKRYFKISYNLISRNVNKLLVPLTFSIYSISLFIKFLILKVKNYL